MEQKVYQEDSSLFKSEDYTIFQMIKIFWQSEHRKKAYLSVLVIFLMTMFLVGMDVAFTYWYNHFYNALQAYDKSGTIKLLFLFFGMAGVFIIVAVYRFYIYQLFGLKWRRWLTNQFINRWLSNRGYYLLENFDTHTDNPDQRIQEDVGSLVNYTIELTVGIVSAVTTFFAFIFVLWSLSGVLEIPLGSFGTFKLHGYLVWVGVIYAFVGTFVTFKVGYPLIGLNFEQQRREATFRFAAVDLRTHAEHVALYRGEHHQGSILRHLFGRVLDNWYLIILRQKLLLWFTSGYNQISVILPLMVALPNYFSKVFLLGGLIQTLSAFRSVQESISFLVNSYTTIAQWRAVGQRLTTFMDHLHEVEDYSQRRNQLVFNYHSDNSIQVSDVTIDTPRDSVLLKNINETLIKGNNYLIKGPSGIGKSTFIRAIAGIWPFASGHITMPDNKQCMYLPQKPYMPIGTLAEAILFPDKDSTELESQLESVLRACRLEAFIPRLHETASWSEQLSPGEQQRVAFARVLLHKPDWVFLDESTSSLDLANEKHLYELLQTKLPECSIVSVGHRPSIDVYHEHIIDMGKYSPATA